MFWAGTWGMRLAFGLELELGVALPPVAAGVTSTAATLQYAPIYNRFINLSFCFFVEMNTHTCMPVRRNVAPIVAISGPASGVASSAGGSWLCHVVAGVEP